MENKEKKIIFGIALVIVLFVALTHFELVVSFFSYVTNMILPIIIGLILAFVLNVPATGFENILNRIFAKKKHKISQKAINIIALILTLLCVALVITLLCTLVIPELVRTVKSIATLIEENWSVWMTELEKYNIDTTRIKEWVASFDFESLFKRLTDNVGTVIGSVADITTSTVSVISSAVIGIIIAIYVLASRKTLGRQSKKVLYAYVKTKTADKICYICSLIKTAYTKFFTGQCVEAVILGVLIFIAFSIFRLPYAGLVGVVTAICAMIPYIGAFISCALGVILALLTSPEKAIMCLIVYLAVQFVETQFIYPHVVGGSVGLSPLWTLIAVLLGGKLFGMMGMIFFIPLTSVIYYLLKEDIDLRLNKKRQTENLPDNLEIETKEGEQNETK